MCSVDKAVRRNRALLFCSTILFAGALGLLVFGRRGFVEWLILLTCFVNLMSALASRRAPRRSGAAVSGVSTSSYSDCQRPGRLDTGAIKRAA